MSKILSWYYDTVGVFSWIVVPINLLIGTLVSIVPAYGIYILLVHVYHWAHIFLARGESDEAFAPEFVFGSLGMAIVIALLWFLGSITMYSQWARYEKFTRERRQRFGS